MELDKRRFPLALFGFALFCFLLPFVTLSCPGGTVTMSGVNLVTGVQIENQHVPPNAPAAGAAFCLVAGGMLAYSLRKDAQALALGASGIAASLLLVLKHQMEQEAAAQAGGLLAVSFGAGFWMALVASLGAGAWCAVNLRTHHSSGIAKPAGQPGEVGSSPDVRSGSGESV